ncbi:unnamed protein product [Brassicogethes aeneus]|uniref:HAT C-terminal dimerisation domain-containing protein n=1 Tax=Brassicogethes aeneus TaxID=1431903 RepID=A0A9P0FHY0_BRAAE|nr:unnamed protein product [Brassicogethes aeneus]
MLSKFYLFSLSKPIKFNDLSSIVIESGLSDQIDLDALYEEFCEMKPALELAYSSNLPILDKWNSIFKENNFKYILKIVQFVFSLFGFNANAERVFSMCSALW